MQVGQRFLSQTYGLGQARTQERCETPPPAPRRRAGHGRSGEGTSLTLATCGTLGTTLHPSAVRLCTVHSGNPFSACRICSVCELLGKGTLRGVRTAPSTRGSASLPPALASPARVWSCARLVTTLPLEEVAFYPLLLMPACVGNELYTGKEGQACTFMATVWGWGQGGGGVAQLGSWETWLSQLARGHVASRWCAQGNGGVISGCPTFISKPSAETPISGGVGLSQLSQGGPAAQPGTKSGFLPRWLLDG